MPNGFQEEKKLQSCVYNTLHCAFKLLSWNPEKHIYIMQQQEFPNHCYGIILHSLLGSTKLNKQLQNKMSSTSAKGIESGWKNEV